MMMVQNQRSDKPRMCVECSFFRTRTDTRGKNSYWCVLFTRNLGPRVFWKRACSKATRDHDASDTKRDLP